MQETSIAGLDADAATSRPARMRLPDGSWGPLESIVRSMAEQMPSASELRSFRRLLAELSKRGRRCRDHEMHTSLVLE